MFRLSLSAMKIKKNIEEEENTAEKKLMDGKEMPTVRQKERRIERLWRKK